MKFRAEHISFLETDAGFRFTLGEKPGLPGDSQQEAYVILQFGLETEAEISHGLHGLHIHTSNGKLEGYGMVERIAYDGKRISITGVHLRDQIEAEIATDMMSDDAITSAVWQCNQVNGTEPEA